MIKENCFGFDARCGIRRDNRCTALNKLYCEYEECKFYKTKKQVEYEEKRRKNGY